MLKLPELLQIPSFVEQLKDYNSALEDHGPFEGGILYQGGIGTEGSLMPDSAHMRLRNGFTHAISGSRSMLEIGFNAGYSALVYLYLNPRPTYQGVDLFLRDYTEIGYKKLLELFPGRVDLAKGSSTEVLPRMISNFHFSSDTIHIDGGHSYECALADLLNCAHFCNRSTLVILDDAPAVEVNRAMLDALHRQVYMLHPLSAIYADTAQAYLIKA